MRKQQLTNIKRYDILETSQEDNNHLTKQLNKSLLNKGGQHVKKFVRD